MKIYVVDTGRPYDSFQDCNPSDVAGKMSESSGAGFGIRDEQFEYLSEDDAREVADGISQLFEQTYGPKKFNEAGHETNWYVGVYEDTRPAEVFR